MPQLFINVLLILLLIVMGIQDFRYRAISWYAFPLLAALLMLSNPALDLETIVLNAGFIVLNYTLASVLISLKHGRIVNLMQEHIGPGDLLMLFCLACYFPVPSFFLFYFGSLVIIGFIVGIYLLAWKPKQFTIPLAGLQSLLLVPVLVATWTTGWGIENLNWLENYLQ